MSSRIEEDLLKIGLKNMRQIYLIAPNSARSKEGEE
jgi:hypothetical protein